MLLKYDLLCYLNASVMAMKKIPVVVPLSVLVMQKSISTMKTVKMLKAELAVKVLNETVYFNSFANGNQEKNICKHYTKYVIF